MTEELKAVTKKPGEDKEKQDGLNMEGVGGREMGRWKKAGGYCRIERKAAEKRNKVGQRRRVGLSKR